VLFWVVVQSLVGSAGLFLKSSGQDSPVRMSLAMGRVVVVILITLGASGAISLGWSEERIFAVSLIGHPILYFGLELLERVSLRLPVQWSGVLISIGIAAACTPLFMAFAAI
jgi:hypothetical protein